MHAWSKRPFLSIMPPPPPLPCTLSSIAWACMHAHTCITYIPLYYRHVYAATLLYAISYTYEYNACLAAWLHGSWLWLAIDGSGIISRISSGMSFRGMHARQEDMNFVEIYTYVPVNFEQAADKNVQPGGRTYSIVRPPGSARARMYRFLIAFKDTFLSGPWIVADHAAYWILILMYPDKRMHENCFGFFLSLDV